MKQDPREIRIAQKIVGPKRQPFIIAEMSGNHNHSLKRALAIVDAAARAGVQAVKIQTYTAETMTLNSRKRGFVINDRKSLWHGKSLYQLYQQAATPREWHKPIFDWCRKLGIIGFSTPFDQTAVDFLEKLNVPCYKIASFELVDIPLIKRVAETGKPIILSTGMAKIEEIREAIAAVRSVGNRQIVLLKCTSSYPASPTNSNLLTIPDMAKRFKCLVGVSDHTLGIGVALAGITLGASVIEKHFTLSRADGGVDSAFSLEPQEMKQLVAEAEKTWQALGRIFYGPTEQEKKSLVFRRSIYVVKDVKEGEIFTKNNLRSIRPGFGLAPKYYDKLLGKRAQRNIRKGTALNWEGVE